MMIVLVVEVTVVVVVVVVEVVVVLELCADNCHGEGNARIYIKTRFRIILVIGVAANVHRSTCTRL